MPTEPVIETLEVTPREKEMIIAALECMYTGYEEFRWWDEFKWPEVKQLIAKCQPR